MERIAVDVSQIYGTIDGFYITKGEAYFGGGIYNSGTVNNCTVYENLANNYGGGGIYNWGTVTNCISWNNINGDIVGSGEVCYSCFSGGSENGNISANPLFVNTSGDVSTWDFHLKQDSPCIDAGTGKDAPEFDMEGIPRPQGIGHDMGAYELPFPDSARFIVGVAPHVMESERQYEVSITMKNIGSNTWTKKDGYQLGDCITTNSLWGVSRVDLAGDTTAPDEKTTFTFTITAPSMPGFYDFQCQMIKAPENKWFGEKTPPQKIKIFEEIPGDVNNDGRLTIEDYILLKDHLLGRALLDTEAASRADANMDNELNVCDVIRIILGCTD